MHHHRQSRGFTLIELLIVMVIASILAMIAMPSYQASVTKSRRADARVALNDIAQRLERCYTQFGRYDDAVNCGIADGDVIASSEDFYRVTVAIPDATTYTLTAGPHGPQTVDTDCGNLAFTNTGVRSADGDNPDRCW